MTIRRKDIVNLITPPPIPNITDRSVTNQGYQCMILTKA